MIPNPQALDVLRARYQLALTPTYDLDTLTETLPALLPAHRFESEDGLLLIITREFTANDLWIHFAAGAEGQIRQRILKGMRQDDFIQLAIQRWRSISGDQREVVEAGASARGIQHFMVVEELNGNQEEFTCH